MSNYLETGQRTESHTCTRSKSPHRSPKTSRNFDTISTRTPIVSTHIKLVKYAAAIWIIFRKYRICTSTSLSMGLHEHRRLATCHARKIDLIVTHATRFCSDAPRRIAYIVRVLCVCVLDNVAWVPALSAGVLNGHITHSIYVCMCVRASVHASERVRTLSSAISRDEIFNYTQPK